jgi:prevent-host-death family protein
MMNTWSAQDAKAQFSEFLDVCLNVGPQVVSLRGKGVAVLVRIEDWKRLHSTTHPSIKSVLLSDQVPTEFFVPKRGSAKRRALISG